jgi:hypothetical protein
MVHSPSDYSPFSQRRCAQAPSRFAHRLTHQVLLYKRWAIARPDLPEDDQFGIFTSDISLRLRDAYDEKEIGKGQVSQN